MKIKNKILIIGILAVGICLGFRYSNFEFAPAVQAKKNDEPLHVYYSESIGAGDRVYHVTSCMKARSYAPQRCSLYMGQPPVQCGELKTVKDENGVDRQVLEKEGTPVKACFTDTADIPYRSDAPYPDVKEEQIKEYEKENHGYCSDRPENIVFNYVPEWAIVDSNAEDDPSYPNVPIYGTVAFAAESPNEVSDELIKEIRADGKTWNLYRATLCKSWDIFPDGDNPRIEALFDETEAAASSSPASDASGSTKTPLQNLIDKFNDNFLFIDDEACDTDNSRQEVASYAQSTPFDEEPTYSCTIQWRITGSSGSDIFGQYVSAIYKWVTGVVGIFAVLIITFSGVQISMAGGDSAVIDKAKNRIMQSLMGLAVLFLAALILYTINPSFFTG